MRTAVSLVAIAALLAGVPRAAERTLTLDEVDEAIRLGQTRIAADLTRFHEPYRFPVNQAPVDYVDAITPYRRVVLAAAERAQLGERSFGQQAALELLKTANGQFDFVVELTFHPLNTFVAMPTYEVTLRRGTTRLLPVSVDRQPRFGARVEGLPPSAPVAILGQLPRNSQPMLGGSATAHFAGDALDPNGTYDLVVSEAGRDLARVAINLRKLR